VKAPAAVAALALALAGCARSAPPPPKMPPTDPFRGNEEDDLPRAKRELEVEILDSYQGAEAVDPEAWAGVVDPRTGITRIGVGPDDLAWTRDPKAGLPPRRWPLGGTGWARSKLLEVHVADDGTVGWAFDDVSWRMEVCGRTAVIPLRYTGVYLRDGDRWVPVLEHLSYAQPVSSLIEHGLLGIALDGKEGPPSWSHPVRVVVERAVGAVKDPDKAKTFAAGPTSLVLWPDPAHELRDGAVVPGPGLAQSFDAESVVIEGYRIGVSPGIGSGGSGVGWWAGTLRLKARKVDAAEEASAVEVRLRATFVLEQRAGRWSVIQAHVSAPISDAELAAVSVGSAVGADGTIQCEGAPAAPAPSPLGSLPAAPPAAGTP